MKFQTFIIASVVLTIGACKPSYKATDRPVPTKDSTASVVDTTSSAMNKMPAPVDSSTMSKPDSARIDSNRQIITDSAKITAKTDSALVKQTTDSVFTQGVDSSKAVTTTDSANTKPSMDSAGTARPATQAPESIEKVFTKQYPTAANAEWSNFDSLAAVPIDLRMAGWKKMDAQDHMVKFDYKNETYYAWYDSDGKWIGSAYTMKDLTKLPAAVNTAVNNAIKTRYKDYNVTQVNREFQTGKNAYEVELAKDDSKVRMLVSPSGKITQIFKYSSDKK